MRWQRLVRKALSSLPDFEKVLQGFQGAVRALPAPFPVNEKNTLGAQMGGGKEMESREQ